jgi:tryptophan halogenase
MMGQGVTPHQHHPTADVMSEADLKRFLDDIRSHTLKNVEGLPTHMDYLRSYCPAPAPAR